MCCVASDVPAGFAIPWVAASALLTQVFLGKSSASFDPRGTGGVCVCPRLRGCLCVLLILGPAGTGQQSSPPNVHVFYHFNKPQEVTFSAHSLCGCSQKMVVFPGDGCPSPLDKESIPVLCVSVKR